MASATAILPRRIAFAATATTTATTAAAATVVDSLVADLDASLERISAIPPLLESSQWDGVRTILKTPPVVDLWNAGDGRNTLARIALATGDMEVMEYKDELSISLQMTDQYSYDNNFIYYQPGNGKVKVREPMDTANRAIVQLGEAIDLVNKSMIIAYEQRQN